MKTLSAYEQALAGAWQDVADRACAYRLQVDETTIELRIAGNRLAEMFLPALAHLMCSGDVNPLHITFYLCDSAETGVQPPPQLFTAADYRRYGQRAVAHGDGCSLMYAPFDGLLYAYAHATRQGYFWCRNAAELSIYERAAPVQTLFHWALREFGWQVVHAAAVGTELGGVLLVGNSGAGKSTTALTLLEQRNSPAAALRYLSDDKCLVRLSPQPEAFALFSSAKLKADMLERFPTFRTLIQGWDGNYKVGKGLAFLHPTYAERMIQRFPVRALVALRIAHLQQPRLTPAHGAEVFRVLGPSTVLWLPGAEADNYRFTADLVRTLPCYRLDLALDPADNGRAIHTLLESRCALQFSAAHNFRVGGSACLSAYR